MRRELILVILIIWLPTGQLEAYELETHGAMTLNALNRVLQEDDQLISRLGITLIQNNLGASYYDTSDNSIYERSIDNFEKRIMEEVDKAIKPQSLPGWLLRGAIREDDLGEIAGFNLGSDPHDDPHDPFFRVFHHFFDPVNTLPLNGVPTPDSGGTVHTAPAWALGTTNADAFTNENNAETARRNHYSIKDAREYMYRALTGQDKNGSKAIKPSGTGEALEPIDLAEAEQVRKGYWATTFRALGDIVHLVQDMGQPQHTRNDSHSPVEPEEKQIFEAFVNERALNNSMTCFNGSRPQSQINIDYVSYPITPGFSAFNKYFSSGPGNVVSGNGLADYSNRGFYTAGTNIGSPGNIFPYPNSTSLTQETISHTGPCYPPGSQTVVLKGTVSDTLVGSNAYAPLTVPGLWNGLWNPYIASTGYSLSEVNYNAMADLLVPRSVAYSAGIIKHFFRGRIEVAPPAEGIYSIIDHATAHTSAAGGVDGKPMATAGANAGKPYGFTKIKLKLRNSTPAIVEGAGTFPQQMTNGKLMLVAKYRTNVCYQPDLSGEPKDAAYNTWSGCTYDAIWTRPQDVSISAAKVVDSAGMVDNVAINSASLVQFEFDFSDDPIPVNAWDLYLQVVYRGQLGEETDAVVVHTKDIYEPGYYTNANNSDYVNVDGAFYTAAQIRASTALQDQIRAHGVSDPIASNSIDPWDVPYRHYYIGGPTPAFSVALPIASYSRVVLLADQRNFLVMGEDDIGTGFFAGGVSMNIHQFDSPTLLLITLANGYSWTGNTRFLGPFRGTHYYSLYHHNYRYSDLDADNLSGLSNFAPIGPVSVDLNL